MKHKKKDIEVLKNAAGSLFAGDPEGMLEDLSEYELPLPGAIDAAKENIEEQKEDGAIDILGYKKHSYIPDNKEE